MIISFRPSYLIMTHLGYTIFVDRFIDGGHCDHIHNYNILLNLINEAYSTFITKQKDKFNKNTLLEKLKSQTLLKSLNHKNKLYKELIQQRINTTSR